LHTVTLTTDQAVAVDLSCLVDRVTIHHGRDDSDSQPEASSATLDLSLDTAVDPFPPLEVGAVVTVSTTLAGSTSTRFAGRVTDISQGWEDAGVDTPDRAVAQVIATGRLADLGGRVVGSAPWPQQLDGARVAAVMAAAGLTLDPAPPHPAPLPRPSPDAPLPLPPPRPAPPPRRRLPARPRRRPGHRRLRRRHPVGDQDR